LVDSAGLVEAAARGGSGVLAAGFFAGGGLLSATGAAFARCLIAGFAVSDCVAPARRAPVAFVSLALASFVLPLDVVPPVPRLVTADVVAAFMLDTSYPSL
jgi:hypothetical protein